MSPCRSSVDESLVHRAKSLNHSKPPLGEKPYIYNQINTVLVIGKISGQTVAACNNAFAGGAGCSVLGCYSSIIGEHKCTP
jgi:hypothetical protein